MDQIATEPRVISGRDGLRACLGQQLGISPWHLIDQPAIDAFADATGDRFWIHTDPDRAATSPEGSTIAHGLLTLGLGPVCSYEIYTITGFSIYLNYGFGRVRWPAPLPAGSRVRMRAALTAIDETPGGVTCTIEQVFEREGHDKPVCVAESLVRLGP
jgi:acyl dehydratase